MGIFKIGDIVTLPRERPDNWCQEGDMDEFLGITVKITGFSRSYSNEIQFSFRNDEGWTFLISELEGVYPEVIKEW